MLLPIILVLAAVAAVGISYGTGSFAELSWLWVLPVSYIGAVVALVLVTLLSYIAICYMIDPKKPRDKETPWFRWLSMEVIQLVVTILPVKVIKKGFEKVPTEGRFLLVSNHLHVIDPMFFFYCFPKNQLAIVGKKETSKMFLISHAMPKLLCPTINRENDREALKTVLRCVQLLNEDTVSVAVFPEGRINRYCKLSHFRPGAFKIAQKSKVPIVVCTLRDSHHMLERLVRFKRSTVEMRVLDVIRPEQYAGMKTVEMADMIYKMMAADLGPENILTPEEEENA